MSANVHVMSRGGPEAPEGGWPSATQERIAMILYQHEMRKAPAERRQPAARAQPLAAVLPFIRRTAEPPAA